MIWITWYDGTPGTGMGRIYNMLPMNGTTPHIKERLPFSFQLFRCHNVPSKCSRLHQRHWIRCILTSIRVNTTKKTWNAMINGGFGIPMIREVFHHPHPLFIKSQPLIWIASRLLSKQGTIPTSTELVGNYPNPFNPETWIAYKLAEGGEVTIQIYDARGQVVRTLQLGQKPAAVIRINLTRRSTNTAHLPSHKKRASTVSSERPSLSISTH